VGPSGVGVSGRSAQPDDAVAARALSRWGLREGSGNAARWVALLLVGRRTSAAAAKDGRQRVLHAGEVGAMPRSSPAACPVGGMRNPRDMESSIALHLLGSKSRTGSELALRWYDTRWSQVAE